MIKSFKCKETEKIWNDIKSKKFPTDIQNRALRKLSILDSAMAIDDLKNPPGNHLEGLLGNRKGQISIRINNQWRICFVWNDGEVEDVKIIDYH